MAQAVRLKLRMQKELKLLLTDPPHGASFPFLSPDSDFSDLSSIDAQIEGPEETVYAKGIFKIKIQIPDRYPLQPPIVTFGTPIYHPNIDNGGRICLDILNLPPKGAWQPSLNISTVLASLRLLLSEPNPDDGLMCEASKEYKYNRQAFDHKARSMTEKYAMAGAGESNCSNQCTEVNKDSTILQMEVQELDKEPKYDANECIPTNKKPHGISQKLSLESTSSNKKKGSDNVKEEPNHHIFLPDFVNEMEGKRKRKNEDAVPNECNPNHEKVNGIGRKSSLQTSKQCKDDFDNKENVDPNYVSSLCQHMASPGSSFSQASRSQQLDQHQDGKSADRSIKSNSNLCQSQKKPFGSIGSLQTFENVKMLGSGTFEEDFVDGKENVSANTKTEKLSSVGKKLSLGLKGSSYRQKENNKENVTPVQNLPHSKPQTTGKIGLGRKLSLAPPVQQDCEGNQKQQSHQVVQSIETDVGIIKQKGIEETEESSISETVVVLDSEDSEEEADAAPLRSRMPLARRRQGKWRVKSLKHWQK